MAMAARWRIEPVRHAARDCAKMVNFFDVWCGLRELHLGKRSDSE
jgi:hypothetical protein